MKQDVAMSFGKFFHGGVILVRKESFFAPRILLYAHVIAERGFFGLLSSG